MPGKGLSIFLLKPGRGASDSLAEDSDMGEVPVDRRYPPGTRFFLNRGSPYSPWWKEYFGLTVKLTQNSNRGIAFVPVGNRVMALAFGHARFDLLDDCYEHDFGTRVVLNCVDPRKLKNTDALDPATGKRQRTQVSFETDLTYLGVLGESVILNSLTGKVKDEYKSIAKSITGASSLRVTSSTPPLEICRIFSQST
jgi:uncharacterized protein (TIGR04141 family)